MEFTGSRSNTLRAFAGAGLALALGAAVAGCGGGRTDTAGGGGGGGTAGGAAGGSAVPGGGFAIDTSACDGYQPTAGITDKEIKLGTSGPQSGVYGSAFGPILRGYKAYFDSTNDKGGVKNRKITLISKDDEYKSDKTRSNVDEMVQKDGVFGFVNVVGTPNNLAIREELGEKCIPNLYVGTGAVEWGQVDKYPWLIGSLPSYATEGAVFAEYVKKQNPNAKVAIVEQNDDFGRGYTKAFTEAIKGTGVTITKTVTHEPGASEVDAQVAQIAADKPDAVLLASTAAACPGGVKAVRAQAGWDPIVYVSATCNIKLLVSLAGNDKFKGVITTTYLKDPSDTALANDAAIKEFKVSGAKFGLSAEDLDNGAVAYGWLVGQLVVNSLEKAPELTRKSVMETAYSTKDFRPPLLLDGVKVNTNGATDPFPIESLYIARHDGTSFKPEGSMIDFEGKTGKFITG